MGLFGWFERKVFLGEMVKDYGVLDEKSAGMGRVRTSVVLCRRKGQLKLAFRTTGTSFLSASVNYAMIDATPAALAKLAESCGMRRRRSRAFGRMHKQTLQWTVPRVRGRFDRCRVARVRACHAVGH